MHRSSRHLIDYHHSSSRTTPLFNHNYHPCPVINQTIPQFQPTPAFDCTSAPSQFCTPEISRHIPITNRLTHQKVKLGNPTKHNNNDLERKFNCAIKKGTLLRHSLTITLYLCKNAFEPRHKLKTRTTK